MDAVALPIAIGTVGQRTENNNGAVAQSVEQRTENPCVGGSIPPHTTILGVHYGVHLIKNPSKNQFFFPFPWGDWILINP